MAPSEDIRVGHPPLLRLITPALAAALFSGGGPTPAGCQEISLAGVIDFHVHSAPDSRPRSVSDHEVARMAANADMRGIVLKNHFTMTADGPFMPVQYLEGEQGGAGTGDPAMYQMVPTEQFLDRYAFATACRYAFITRAWPPNAQTSIMSVVAGKWKFVTMASTTRN